MIGHDDKGVKRVANPVKMTQGAFDKFPDGGRFEYARSVIGVEPRLDPFGEGFPVFLFRFRGPRTRMCLQPEFLFRFQLGELVLRQRIGDTKGQENGTTLMPVRKIRVRDAGFGRGTEVTRLLEIGWCQVLNHAVILSYFEQNRVPNL